jgi:cob(I)alamin adenosyltransferase
LRMKENLGKVHVLTGPGKGKTTAAFGLSLRAAGHGLRVCVVQFMKTGMTTGESIAAKQLKSIEIAQFGTGKFVDPKRITKADRRCAEDAMAYTKKVLEGGKCDLVILDEVNLAVSFGLVDPADVIEMLSGRKKGIEVILSGRNAPQEFVDLADYVSYIDNRKHPFESGTKARKGIEW